MVTCITTYYGNPNPYTLCFHKCISLQPNPMPLELLLLLVIPELNRGDQVLVYSLSNSWKSHIKPTPTHILLET